jgi:rhodanese-related sulfurtransferase
MISKKMMNITKTLTQNFFPFTLLSKTRSLEVINLVRFIELNAGETIQIRGSKGQDYLFLIEGSISYMHDDQLKFFQDPETHQRPILLQASPKLTTVISNEDCILCHANREMMDNLISWDEIAATLESSDISQQIDMVKNSLAFRRLPLEHIETAFKRMEPRTVTSGETIVEYGAAGDAFYIIMEGTAEVFEKHIYEDRFGKVIDLGVGDAFGEEALVSGEQRNETVTMTSDGKLLILKLSDYNELIGNTMVKHVNAQVAQAMIQTGIKLLDVRYEEESAMHRIANDLLIPLNQLRSRFDEIDKSQSYVVYCHAGARSSVATLYLQQQGITAYNLDGGIRDWPFATVHSEEF